MTRFVQLVDKPLPQFSGQNRSGYSVNVIYPVLLSISANRRQLPGRERSLYLSRCARVAVQLSARKRGEAVVKFKKNENGAPLPENGLFWSLSHKPEFVAGVAAPAVTGIDIEKIRPCSSGLCKKVANKDEWRLAEPLFGDMNEHVVALRYWTAKEAVLKAAGVGLRGLSHCRILGIPDVNHLIVSYKSDKWLIEQCFFNDHIAAVVKNSDTVVWSTADWES